MSEKISLIIHWIKKVKLQIVQMLHEDPVPLRSLIRHCIGVVICHFLYNANIEDYFNLRLFKRSHAERKTFITQYRALEFIDHINGAENNSKFYQKTYMYQVLGKFTKREQLILPTDDYQAFEDFFQRHRTVLYKPSLYCGEGIELWSADVSDIIELYEKSLGKPAVLDELVTQHPDLARLNPDSLNTLKIFTLMAGDECHFVAAEFRMGRFGSFIDNLEKGGIAANVDIKTGKFIGSAYDNEMKQYTEHPDTGVRLTGYTLPNWDEVLRFTEECARACPLSYVEWDIAIRENDCVLIEANANAMVISIQLGPLHFRKKQLEELEKLYDQSIACK